MKQAVAFILDASPSMGDPYLAGDSSKSEETALTKFRAGQTVIQTMLSDLILQSTANEATVILCNTRETRHHMMAVEEDAEEDPEAIPARNITELGRTGVQKPPARWLRDIEAAQPSSKDDSLEGDFATAFMVAADALHQRTNGKKYERSIVLVTDAQHDVVLDDVADTAWVVQALHGLDCAVHVLGLDFGTSSGSSGDSKDQPVQKTYFARPDECSSSSHLQQVLSSSPTSIVPKEEEPGDGSSSETDDEAGPSKKIKRDPDNVVKEEPFEEESNGGGAAITFSTQTEREHLLARLTRQTGGSITAVHNLQELLNSTQGRKLSSPVKSKIHLNIAPGIQLPCRRMLMLSKATALGLKQGCVVVTEDEDDNDDDDDDKASNPAGASNKNDVEALAKVIKQVLFIDPDHNPDDTYEASETGKAIRFGSDLIPVGDLELRNASSKASKPVELPYMEILGYVARDSVSPTHWIGPPYALTGADSVRTCAALSALAQALESQQKIALCTHLKTKTGAVILGALFPIREPVLETGPGNSVKQEEDGVKKEEDGDFDMGDSNDDSTSNKKEKSLWRLVFLQLPFAGETKTLSAADDLEALMASDAADREAKESVCDRLVDSMMLPPDRLQSGRVRSAFWRSWNQTKVAKVIGAAKSSPAENDGDDPEKTIVKVRTFDDADPMSTPKSIIDRVRPICDEFYSLFPLKKQAAPKKKTGKGAAALTHADFLEE